jgi:hypothetical protein
MKAVRICVTLFATLVAGSYMYVRSDMGLVSDETLLSMVSSDVLGKRLYEQTCPAPHRHAQPVSKRNRLNGSPLSESDLRAFAERLVQVGEGAEAVQQDLHDDGFGVPRVYQDAVLSLARSDVDAREQRDYWREFAKERLGCLGAVSSLTDGSYPEMCVYRSPLIEALRSRHALQAESLADAQTDEIAPLLARFDDGRGARGGVAKFDRAIEERKAHELRQLGIPIGTPFDFAFAENASRYAELTQIYEQIAPRYGFARDDLRSRKDYLCFSKALVDDWQICWADESYPTQFVVRGIVVITQQGLRFDTRQPSPAAIAKIRLNDIIPGVWRYSTGGDRRDMTTLAVMNAFAATATLGVAVSGVL